MTMIFGFIVVIDEWSDRTLSMSVGADVVGLTSVIVWICTLLGSFGIGPVAALWNLARR